MNQKIAQITLLVKDYDEAIEFYTQKIGFALLEDTKLTEEKRWVRISPKGAKETCLLLAKASNAQQLANVGNQAGGRVFMFLFTDNFWRDYKHMTENGVKFHEQPREQIYGTVAVFEDLYGNLWDLLEQKEQDI